MSDVRIIEADESYAQVLTDLARKTFSDTFSADNKPENMEAFLNESYTLEIQRDELNNPKMVTFLALDKDDKAIAFAQLRQRDNVYDFVGDADAIELQRVYVDKDFAGKGTGKMLMAACLERAKAMGKKTMWLGVWEHNDRAIKFYKNHGFYKVGAHTFTIGEQQDTDEVMILKL